LQKQDVTRLSAVRVTWIDSCFDSGWRDKSRGELEPIITLGFVTANRDDSLEVTATMGLRTGMLNPLSIPWGAIQKLEVITSPEDPDGE